MNDESPASLDFAICQACGTQFASPAPPDACPICTDERQFVPPSGQAWTTLRRLRATHGNTWRQHEPGLLAIETQPAFAIGQRAFLLRTPGGNILWDCLSLLDEATAEIIRALGGLRLIAISHPHYYTTMVDWARCFACPVLLHEADRDWVMRPNTALRFWGGNRNEVLPGVTLIRAGGHFAGATVLHAAQLADRRGGLLSGDVLQVLPDGKRVSVMWSYPCLLPLPAAKVRAVADAVSGFSFQRVYGAFAGREILSDGGAAVAQSLRRYDEVASGVLEGHQE
jgi:hypothetical protein